MTEEELLQRIEYLKNARYDPSNRGFIESINETIERLEQLHTDLYHKW